MSLTEEENEWIEIGFKEGHGNSTERNYYQFEDYPLYDGTYHYRLRQVDYDGTSEYSNAVEVNLFTVKEFELSQNYRILLTRQQQSVSSFLKLLIYFKSI